jgi:antitoxin component of RelBE/YafQ-DinJ toxin-antitoxin module
MATPPSTKLEQLNVRIDARLKLEAELIAKRQGRPMTDVISTLLEQWVKDFQAKQSV